ncbi:hypothetical protein Trco_001990 [Trichoderma cornu-damae]|uniref:Uncharacterized protein n=1 Tax=Trichoderma cornu-damae TaxID=654480 RepID=A0A9P8TXE7_9HYPO|nr:hypothetical protein Trco_001990 [Trichoderma cornu-damae]
MALTVSVSISLKIRVAEDYAVFIIIIIIIIIVTSALPPSHLRWKLLRSPLRRTSWTPATFHRRIIA